MYTIHVVVEGTGRGLLMHKFHAQASKELEDKVKKANKGDLPAPEAAELAAYRLDPTDGDSRGQLMIPADHFLGALIGVGSKFRIKGQGKKTYKDTFKGNIDVQPDFLPLTDSEGRPLYDYAIDSRRVRNPSTRGAVIRHRPHLAAGWRVALYLQVSDDDVPIEVIQAAMEEAGRSKAVMDYRPRFGTFRVVSCEKARRPQATTATATSSA